MKLAPVRPVIALAIALAGCSDSRTLSAPCDGGGCAVTLHAPGILDPASPNFHVALLKQNNWGFALCATCHGRDFSGGTSGVSCLSCHAAGPTACVTCHGAGPTSNAHPAHASTALTTVGCNECHVVPTSWDQDGHILHDGVAITTPAQVTLGARANLTLAPTDRAGPASWDGQSCSNVYCHGAVLHAGGGTTTAPRWDDPTPIGGCTTCHGDPPPTPSHARTDCATCHPSSAGHINGVVDLGRVSGCSGCHGSPSSPAPPVDLSGHMFTTALGVGAHQAHLQASSRISAPIACTTCHAVPTAIDSPGHLDSPLPVVTAALGWDRSAQTCTSSYCHGTARPVWTSSGQVSCGSCHGIPPADAPHTPAMTLTSCTSCHPGTVDAFGNIIVHADGTSEHINGDVDLH
ncbi:MAG: CxxxxCH/CxxCH domain-containing protein [Kofleriaceae bacterium]